MDLPRTERGNKHGIVFQDFLTKWPFVFPMLDQKTPRIMKLLVEEIIPVCGVPEALLSDRGTNVLSHLMKDVCNLLGIEKLNTTAYHPQCNGLVERFNRRLGCSGIGICMVSCGHIEIPPTTLLMRNLRFCCSGQIADTLRKLPCCHPHLWMQQMLKTTEKSWCLLCPVLDS